MIFTPGDHVFSSSKIIQEKSLKISDEKLINLLAINKISKESLLKTISDFKNLKSHVIGDMIVDTYTRTKLIGGYTKTPTASVQEIEKKII